MFTAVSAGKGDHRPHFGWDRVFTKVYTYIGTTDGQQSPFVHICHGCSQSIFFMSQ